MADKDLNQANDGVPAVDIPDLKKKEKERKKAGAAWGSAKPGGSPFGAATGGAGAGARAAASAAASGAAGAGAAGAGLGGGLFSGMAGWLSTLLATTMGKALFALGALLLLGGGALVAMAMMAGNQGGLVPNLGALASNMKIDRAGADRTAISGKGDIRFDPLAPKAEEKKAEAPGEEKAAEKPADVLPPGTIDDSRGGVSGKDRLAHNLSGAKLTSDLGGGFGSKNIFGGAGSGNAPRFNGNLAKANLSIPKAQNGKLGAMKSNARTARASKLSLNRAKTQRAFGQLKVARGLSAAGAGATTADAARAGAADAFDQRASNGGVLSTPGGPDVDGKPVSGLGGGAPDLTSVPDVPDVQGVRGDPRMDQGFKAVQDLAAAAAKMKMMGMGLIALGVVLIAIGSAMPVGGWILIAVGVLLIGIGVMMMQQAAQMAAMAKQMGAALADQYGTGTYQKEQVAACTDEVLANGGGNCSREPYKPTETTVQQDIEAERNTPVTMEGGGGPVQ